jgi:hypothetical protein
VNGSIEKTLYHSFLRIAVVVCTLVLVFDSGLLLKSTADISNLAQQHVASVVGVTVGVEPTELNQLTGRITELETELAAKERLIAVSINDSQNNSSIDRSTFILSAILFILLVLIVINYALDYLRLRRIPQQYDETTQGMA